MPSIHQSLTAFNKDRLPDMVKLKYKAMSVNAFSFFRGTCHLFYRDLEKAGTLPASPLTWICGDLHLENFGSFKGDNHQVYFDLNDFDEALLAPAAWELVRMLTSIFIAFDDLNLQDDEALKVAQMYLDTYAEKLKKGKAVGIDPRTAEGIVCTFLTNVEKRKQKEFLKKRTVKKKGKLCLIHDKEKHFEIEKPLKKELQAFVNEWMKTSCFAELDFTVLDSIFRVAGTGSIGVKRYLFLLESRAVKNKFLFLDMKEAFESSVLPYADVKQPVLGSEAERIIAIKQRMQYVSPALSGAAVFKDEPYVLQQLQPMEDKINFELIKDRYRDVDQVIGDMAKLTASAQLRSSGRQGSAIADEMIAFAQIGQWQKILTYAIQYAKQVKLDYREFMTGYNKGKY
jgi:uncharacterized protein (DUF2252 family)